MELIRILRNKKFIAATVVLLLLNCAIFYVAQQKNAQENGFILSDYAAVFRENISLLSDETQQIYAQNEKFQTLKSFADFETSKASDPQQYAIYAQQEAALIEEEPLYYEEYQSGCYSHAQIVMCAEFYAHFAAQLDYQNGYAAYIDSVLEKGEALTSRKLFSNSHSYSYKSIQKTVADYAQNKSIQLSAVNDYLPSVVLSYQAGDLILVLLCVFTVIAFVAGKDFSLLLHTCAKGRIGLKVRQIVILFGMSLLFSVLTYTPEFLLAQNLYGIPFDFNAAIQSSQMFADSVLPLNFGQLFAVLIVFKACMAAVYALVIFLLIVLASNIVFACTVSGAFIAAEFLMYQNISAHSTVSFFKSVNIFSLLDYKSLTDYSLLSLFSVPVQTGGVVCIVLAVIFLAACCLLLFVSARCYPVRSPGKLLRGLSVFTDKLSVISAKVQSVFYGRKFETFKIMHIGRGLLIFVVFCVIIGASLNTNALAFSPTQTFLNAYYEKYGGKLNEAVYDSLEEMQHSVDAVQAEFEEQSELFSQGALSLEEYELANAKNDAFKTQREALGILNKQVASLEKLQLRGIEPVLMNESGYNSLFSGDTIQNGILLSIGAVILMFSSAFSTERANGMYALNHSAKRGRMPLVAQKFAAVFLPVFLLCAVSYLAAVYRAYRLFGLSDFSASIQNLQLLQGVQLNVSIFSYLVMGFVFEFVLVTAVAFIVVSLSSFVPQIVVTVIAGAVFLLPSLFYAANILPVSALAVTQQFSLNSVLMAGQGVGAFAVQIGLLAVAAGFTASSAVHECKTRTK